MNANEESFLFKGHTNVDNLHENINEYFTDILLYKIKKNIHEKNTYSSKKGIKAKEINIHFFISFVVFISYLVNIFCLIKNIFIRKILYNLDLF